MLCLSAQQVDIVSRDGSSENAAAIKKEEARRHGKWHNLSPYHVSPPPGCIRVEERGS